MKKILLCLALALTCLRVQAAPPDAGSEKKLLRAAVAVDKDTKPTDTFSSTVPKLWAFWIGDGVKAGDKIRGVWIAEDVGDAAPADTKIDEVSLTATKDKDSGAFSLSKPTKGWPVGEYRVEIYIGDTLAETVKFEIEEE